ncbi:MAG: hypothetical protein Q4G23_08255 [Clostridia bacterium]|nr:hypothetical protein [Clostridia bacterium]
MKKLVFARFIIYVVWLIPTILMLLLLTLFDQKYWLDMEAFYSLTVRMSIALVSVLYFFAGKKCYDVNLKKLLLIFSIWSIIISLSVLLTSQPLLLLLSGALYCYTNFIPVMFPVTSPALCLILGFAFEMIILMSGIIYGRLSNKYSNRPFFTYYKISSLLLWILSMLFFYSITLIFLKIPYTVLKQNIALESGRIISGALCCLWYFFAGIKTSKGNLLKTLSAISLWNVLAVILRFVSTSFIPLYLSGGYISLLSAVSVFTNSKAIIYLSAFAVELALISSGVLFGRHLDKKKAKKFKENYHETK